MTPRLPPAIGDGSIATPRIGTRPWVALDGARTRGYPPVEAGVSTSLQAAKWTTFDWAQKEEVALGDLLRDVSRE